MALDFKRYRFTVHEYEEMGRAGIFDEDARVEVWLVDLRRDVVEVYRNPTRGGYLSVRVARRGESIAPEALPDRSVAVSDLLPNPE